MLLLSLVNCLKQKIAAVLGFTFSFNLVFKLRKADKILSKYNTMSSKQLLFNYGVVLKVADNIATVVGLPAVQVGEVVTVQSRKDSNFTLKGLVLNLQERSIGVVLMGDDSNIVAGDVVFRSFNLAVMPVG
jgi:F-type H+/Na+-transporting ATPase subunit alpha